MNQNVTPPDKPPSPARACIVCTVPHTGSALLCEALSKTGLVGRPAEYFDTQNQQQWMQSLNIERRKDYVDKVIERGTTPNGVFGLSLLWHQIPALLDSFAAASGGDASMAKDWTFNDWLNTRFASSHYLWLRRRNKVAQGISWFRASQAEAGPGRRKPAKSANSSNRIPFNFDEIDRHVSMVEQFDRKWHEFFTQKKIRALVLVYEDFIANYGPTIRGVCKYVGVPDDGLAVVPSLLQRQADELSLEWEADYRKLKGDNRAPAQAAAVTAPLRVAAAGTRNTPRPAASLASKKPGGAVAANSLDLDSIIAYDISPHLGVQISKASSRRAWIDAMPERHAYRCLPLVIANQYGWLLLNPEPFTAVWNGGMGLDAVTITYPAGVTAPVATSHFGAGIVTFATCYLFRTPPGINLLARGPANMPKDGVSPLEGIIETDWSESSFTMNWKITRPHHPVVFEKGEPFCMMTPIARGDVERYKPEIRHLSDDPELEAGYRAWSLSRDSFNSDLKVKDSAAQKARWQRHYLRGETVSQDKAREHQTAIALRDFVDRRK